MSRNNNNNNNHYRTLTVRRALAMMAAFFLLLIARLAINGNGMAHTKALLHVRSRNSKRVQGTSSINNQQYSNLDKEETRKSNLALTNTTTNNNSLETMTSQSDSNVQAKLLPPPPPLGSATNTAPSYESFWSADDDDEEEKTAIIDMDDLQFALYPQPRTPQELLLSRHGLHSYRTHICRGPVYDDFAQQLHAYARQVDVHGPDWGRRQRQRGCSIPPNTTILAFGNSHTRQVAMAWMVQQMPADLHQVTAILPGFATSVELQNGAVVYIVTNSFVPFAQDWQLALSNLTDGKALNDFDAIIVGNVNGCVPDKMQQFHDYAGHFNLSCANKPPSLQDWMQAYDYNTAAGRRLLFLTSFMQRKRPADQAWAQTVAEVRKQQQQADQQHDAAAHKVGFIYGRHHVDALGHEGADRPTSTMQAPGDAACPTCESSGHRCIGRYGGHPDLVAFDVAEWIWTGTDSFNHAYTPRPFVQNLQLGL